MWKHLYSPSEVEPFIYRILGWKTVLLFPDFTAERPFSAVENSKPVPLSLLLAFFPQSTSIFKQKPLQRPNLELQ